MGNNDSGDEKPAGPQSWPPINVKVNGKRTSLRMEPQIWDALREVARREDITDDEICSRVAVVPNPSSSSLTGAVRVCLLLYFRLASDPQAVASGRNLLEMALEGLPVTPAGEKAETAPE